MAQNSKQAQKFGFEIKKPMDFSTIMEHVRTTRREVYEEADDPNHFREMGIDIAFGRVTFVDDHTIAIRTNERETQRISSRYIVIATGSKAMAPSISGLEGVPYLTNETIFELEKQPRRLGIIGAGPIGIEMAQAFQRLDTQVTVFDMQPRILSSDDEELAIMLHDRLNEEGIKFRLSASIKKISESDSGEVQVTAEIENEEQVWTGDALLVAVGRVANHNHLNLDKAGIEYIKNELRSIAAVAQIKNISMQQVT